MNTVLLASQILLWIGITVLALLVLGSAARLTAREDRARRSPCTRRWRLGTRRRKWN